uniref:Endoplasmic reticulum-Golgi intermediate compartment protein 3 n=1 Tax=Heterorhabditis bacteriophora TaxID=37862 RepID=A0A1I7XVP3_HETBA
MPLPHGIPSRVMALSNSKITNEDLDSGYLISIIGISRYLNLDFTDSQLEAIMHMTLLSKLREFDAYTKPMEDFRVKTLTGGFVTLVAAIVIVILSISETAKFLSTDVVEQLYVDSTSSDQRVDVNFDITFFRLPCSCESYYIVVLKNKILTEKIFTVVTIDVMDISSDAQDNIQDEIYKLRIDSAGNNLTDVVQKIEVNQNKTVIEDQKTTTLKCGSCYGAMPQGACCNTCDEVKEAYQIKGWQVNIEEVEQCKSDRWVKLYTEHKGEGCRVYGRVQVAKVAGNFHLAPGDPYRTIRSHVHDLHSLDPSRFDTSHLINHLSFGDSYPGKKYPMDGRRFDNNKGGIMYQYYVKVVPTSYVYLDGKYENSHQFSITTHNKDLSEVSGISGLPGFFVQYEFSPLMVRYEERRQHMSTFLVSLCAIIGGVFTVAQLIDACIYHSSRVIEKKMLISKLG